MNTTADEKSLETMISDHGDDLCHYGVPDQKHGVRRYQYMDGRLTPLGRLHYGIGFKNIGQVEAARRAKAKAEKEKEEAKERKRAEDVDRVTRIGNAEEIYNLRESMTDAELTRAVQRMNTTRQLEQALASATNKRVPDNVEPKKMSFFEKQKAKKAEEKAREAAEKAEKEKKAREAIDKGLQVLDTATKVTNTVANVYTSYNKMASIINEVGGTTLPTFASDPWNKKKPSKNEEIIKTGDANKILESASGMTNEELSNAAKRLTSLKVIKGQSSGSEPAKVSSKEEKADRLIDKKDWTVSSTYDETKSKPSFSFGGDTKWSTVSESPAAKKVSKDGGDYCMSVLNSMGRSSLLEYEDSPSYKRTQSIGQDYCMSILNSTGPKSDADILMDMMRHGESYVGDWLCHYGRKDQKWGVRRYQNLDGSLTPEGRERYGKLRKKMAMDNPNASDKQRVKQLEAAAQSYRFHQKTLSKMQNPTDNEIRRTIEKSVHPFRNVSTASHAYAGAMVGGPIGAAIAGVRRANTVQADMSNAVVLGREVMDRYITDPKYYSKAMYRLNTVDVRYISQGRELIESMASKKVR